jgi:hypothetical protein
MREILKVLDEEGRPMEAGEIAERTDFSTSLVFQTIRWKNCGRVKVSTKRKQAYSKSGRKKGKYTVKLYTFVQYRKKKYGLT